MQTLRENTFSCLLLERFLFLWAKLIPCASH